MSDPARPRTKRQLVKLIEASPAKARLAARNDERIRRWITEYIRDELWACSPGMLDANRRLIRCIEAAPHDDVDALIRTREELCQAHRSLMAALRALDQAEGVNDA